MRACLTGFIVVLSCCTLALADDPANLPANLTVAPDAQAVMKETQSAYGVLKSLEVSGTISRSSKRLGLMITSSKKFSGSYVAPSKFRLQVDSDRPGKSPDLFGCTGKVAYCDQRDHALRMAGDVAGDGDPVARIDTVYLGMYTCSPMSFAVIKSLAERIVRDSRLEKATVKREADELVDGKPYLKVVRVATSDLTKRTLTTTLLIDPDTRLLRREINESQDATGVTTTLTDVESTKVNGNVDEEQFRWSPPAEWTDPHATPAPPAPPAPPADKDKEADKLGVL